MGQFDAGGTLLATQHGTSNQQAKSNAPFNGLNTAWFVATPPTPKEVLACIPFLAGVPQHEYRSCGKADFLLRDIR